MRGHQVFERVIAGIFDHPVDLHRPRVSRQRMSIAGRVFLLGAELIEVVVPGHSLKRRRLIHGQRVVALCKVERPAKVRHTHKASGQSAPQKVSPVEVHRFRRDLVGADVRAFGE